MTHPRLTYFALLRPRAGLWLGCAALVALGACQGTIPGVHLSSQVMGGSTNGLDLEPLLDPPPGSPSAEGVTSAPGNTATERRERSEDRMAGFSASGGNAGLRRQTSQQRTEAAATLNQAPAVSQVPVQAPSQSASTQTAAAQTAPVQAVPVQAAPVQAPPVQAAPVAAAPVAAASLPAAPSFNGTKSTTAGLGDPGREGLWMETPLVSQRRNARITAPNGKSVVVTLEPISGDAGAGSRLSIGAMRALGLPLTELVKLTVGPA